MTSFNLILIYSGLATLVSIVLGWIPTLKLWKTDHLHGFICFSGGVLLSTAFTIILPHALEGANAHTVGIGILISFTLLFILEKFVMIHPCEEAHCHYHTVGVAALAGMFIHTLFDGLVLGAAIKTQAIGHLVFAAIIAHKAPASFSLGALLVKANWSKLKVLISLFTFGALIGVGGLLSLFLIQEFSEGSMGFPLALSAGTFIYIATSDFLPEVHRTGHGSRVANLIYFVLGILFTVLLTSLLSH